MERRSQKRVQLRIPVDLRVSGRTLSATLLDLSEGGLSVRLAEEELEQGTPVEVILAKPKGEPFAVESLVWHSRRLKPRKGETTAWVLGLVVANPSDAYLMLVSEQGSKGVRSRASPPAPAPEARMAPKPHGPAQAPAGPLWRVRLQLSGSPRSRTLVIESQNTQDAAVRALEEAGADWIVLEVTEA
jgi:hypothetical protein